MTKKKLFILIEGTVFPYDILFSVAEDKELFKYIEGKKKYKLSDEEKEKLKLSSAGRTVQLRGHQTIIRLRREKTSIGFDLPVLVHEVEHAVFMILDYTGVKHVDESDEIFSYFQEYVIRTILDVVEPNKKKGRQSKK